MSLPRAVPVRRLAAGATLLLAAACGKGSDAAAAAGDAAKAPGPLSAEQTSAGLPADHPSTNATPTDMPLALRTALDSGNAAFRAKDYAGAMAWYRKAAADPGDASGAGLIGMSMAAGAMNDKALADSIAKALEARGMGGHTMPGAAPAMPASPHGAMPPLTKKSS